MSSFAGSAASLSEMGSSPGFERRSHRVAQAAVFERDFKGTRVGRGRPARTSRDNSGERS